MTSIAGHEKHLQEKSLSPVQDRPEKSLPQPEQPPLTIYTDGGCVPVNPGGYGCWAFVVYDGDGQELTFRFGCLGEGSTNNLAEAHGILEALQWARAEQYRGILIHSDSQLLVRQIQGFYEVHAEHLRPLVHQAQDLLADVHGMIQWIRREANTRADGLTRIAYQQAIRKGGGA
jgi:ribonuclease HI